MRLLFLTPDLSSNSLGRTYCLYLLAQSLGWESETVSIKGSDVWPPLASSSFANTCSLIQGTEAHVIQTICDRLEKCDLMIAVKPLKSSLGIGLKLQQHTNVPLIIDIDDPDIEAMLAQGSPVRAAAKWLLRTRIMLEARSYARAVRRSRCLVSNPELQRRYGGVLIPHVRSASRTRVRPYSQSETVVAFIGTNRPHKGVDILREAVARLASEGYSLIVTDDPPNDALRHERWIGRTTFEEGLQHVADADIVAIPSRSSIWARGQLPVKLVDAMLSATPVIVSDLPPLPWAVGPEGRTFKPGSVDELVKALRELSDVVYRRSYGELLRKRGEDLFSLSVVAPRFEAACRDALLNA